MYVLLRRERDSNARTVDLSIKYSVTCLRGAVSELHGVCFTNLRGVVVYCRTIVTRALHVLAAFIHVPTKKEKKERLERQIHRTRTREE